MRLLVLYQANDSVRDQPGYHDGFSRLRTEGLLHDHKAIPYLSVSKEQGWNGLWQNAYDTARDMQADAIFLQFFHGPIPDPGEAIRRLKLLPTRPVIFTSLGDAFGRITKKMPKSFRIASALSDTTFLTGMGYLARQLAASGARNLVLMPHGCCQVRFSSPPEASSQPEFDVTFVGSRVLARNPFNHYYRLSRKRTAFVDAMTKRYGKRFGLFGKGWEGNPSWQGPIAFARQHQPCANSAVALGGMPNASHDYYMSDRPFIMAASGVPFVDQWLPGVDRILESGRDWWLVRGREETFATCDKLIEMPNPERMRCGRQAREHILSRHTQYHRCREMIGIVSSLREARLAGRRAPRPELGFLSEAAATESFPEPIVGWQG